MVIGRNVQLGFRKDTGRFVQDVADHLDIGSPFPEIITILQNTLASGCYHQSPNPGMSSELYQSLLLRINDLKQIVDNSKATQLRLESCLSSEGPIARHAKLTQSLEQPEPAFTDGQRAEISRSSHHVVAEAHGEKVRESLSGV